MCDFDLRGRHATSILGGTNLIIVPKEVGTTKLGIVRSQRYGGVGLQYSTRSTVHTTNTL